MAADPYHAVQQEIQSALQTTATLRASFLRIRSTARGETEELVWARNELKASLAALEADLEDLEESVKMVESTDARLFGLTDAEVLVRRRYVKHAKGEIENMRNEVSDGPPPSYSNATSSGNDEDHQGEWAREEQQMMIREQDRTMDSIAGTLSTLAQQAGLMGREIGEQVEMLDDLEQGVTHTDTKLSSAMQRMRRFIRQTEHEHSGWCIFILIVVLVILLLAVVLV